MKVYVLIVLATIEGAFSQGHRFSVRNQYCRNIRGEGGRCLPLLQCPILLDEMKNGENRISFQLQGDPCGGFQSGQLNACCPVRDRGPKETFETPRPQALQYRPSTGPFSGDRPFTGTFGPDRPSTDTFGRDRPSTGTFGRDRPSTGTFGRDRPSTDTFGRDRPSTVDFENSRDVMPTISSTGTEGGGGQRSRTLLPENTCGIDISKRILNGEQADIDEFPWMALLQYRNARGQISHNCGGVLISRRYVLTAAHCMVPQLNLTKVRLGEWDKSTDPDSQGGLKSPPVQEIRVEQLIRHRAYNPSDKMQVNDIMLIRLEREATFSTFVQPICLPFDTVAKINFDNKTVTAAGWGKTTNRRNSESDIKMKVDLRVSNSQTCSKALSAHSGAVRIRNTQMCAQGTEGKDTCQGDSGGPLMSTEIVDSEIKWFVVGIVSTGPAACGSERPAIYTRVTEYLDWILDNIRR